MRKNKVYPRIIRPAMLVMGLLLFVHGNFIRSKGGEWEATFGVLLFIIPIITSLIRNEWESSGRINIPKARR